MQRGERERDKVSILGEVKIEQGPVAGVFAYRSSSLEGRGFPSPAPWDHPLKPYQGHRSCSRNVSWMESGAEEVQTGDGGGGGCC